ncbi:MAG: hypothetical protein CVT62_09975 [Actinobacteria bacterium HGW-Actinobacteria-2]|nr:MAG: hypothetical protein CVT62_09975 [Actinobacteria bacterium HGW-Actinobacteria-2]
MMGMAVIIALVAMLSAIAIALIVGLRAAARKQLTAPPNPSRAKLVATQLDALDQRLASGQVSPADYAAERNRLLGLPAPEQR